MPPSSICTGGDGVGWAVLESLCQCVSLVVCPETCLDFVMHEEFQNKLAKIFTTWKRCVAQNSQLSILKVKVKLRDRPYFCARSVTVSCIRNSAETSPKWQWSIVHYTFSDSLKDEGRALHCYVYIVQNLCPSYTSNCSCIKRF